MKSFTSAVHCFIFLKHSFCVFAFEDLAAAKRVLAEEEEKAELLKGLGDALATEDPDKLATALEKARKADLPTSDLQKAQDKLDGLSRKESAREALQMNATLRPNDACHIMTLVSLRFRMLHCYYSSVLQLQQ